VASKKNFQAGVVVGGFLTAVGVVLAVAWWTVFVWYALIVGILIVLPVVLRWLSGALWNIAAPINHTLTHYPENPATRMVPHWACSCGKWFAVDDGTEAGAAVARAHQGHIDTGIPGLPPPPNRKGKP
jgi:hypothetical protein